MDDVKTILTVYVPISLVQRAGTLAQANGVSRNRFVVEALREAIREDDDKDVGEKDRE